tara:strand:- start:1056 stop:1256 length:201 start_codon:yes stop_codon:yes gene_type:complete
MGKKRPASCQRMKFTSLTLSPTAALSPDDANMTTMIEPKDSQEAGPISLREILEWDSRATEMKLCA